MRTPGKQPRILLTNVKQLELLLTRQRDVELFANARLEVMVFDECPPKKEPPRWRFGFFALVDANAKNSNLC